MPIQEIPFRGKHQVNIVNTNTALDIFRYFFDDTLIEDIVYNTNLYANQKDVNRPLNLTKGELFVFLGMNITMTYTCIRYPRLRMYWSIDPSIRCNMVSDAMSVNRFESIRRFLHFTDNNSHGITDDEKLWKIRPILEGKVQKCCRSRGTNYTKAL